MFRIGGGWDGNRWWFGRVIKTLDICFNELATQQIATVSPSLLRP